MEPVKRPVCAYEWLDHPAAHLAVGWYLVSAFLSLPMLGPAHMLGTGVAWVAADAISYGIHVFIDSEFYDRNVARPKKSEDGAVYAVIDEHHTKPMNYSTLTDRELVYVTYPAVLVIMLLFLALDTVACVAVSSFYSSAYVSLRFWLPAQGLLTNHAHKWAHERAHGLPIPWTVARLQDARLLLGPAAHQPHHKTLKSHYSLYNGVTQLLLDGNWGARR